ncbi:unnamed protein product [Scytosiphon promiscuus]
MSVPLAEAGEEEAAAARLAFDTDTEGPPASGQNGSAAAKQEGDEDQHDSDEDDVREGETREEALQRRIEEGKIGKGKTLRRWKDTEEKQRMVETYRHESKVQRYGQIYEEVRALRKETRHSVQDLRERFKEKGVIQNKDQFIVKLIAQERNEQEGKVAAIKSLQQWRLTDVELHNFINRCHKKGIAGKLDLAMQWAVEQEEAGGEVNFKEGLAFYSSIGILQPRSSAHTQQQWREWREWEDALTYALDKFKTTEADGAAATKGADAAAGVEGSCSNEDSTVDGRFRSRSGTATDNGTPPEQVSKDATAPQGRRGRTPSHRDDSREGEKRDWNWRSYSPPSSLSRQKDGGSAEGGAKKRYASPRARQPASGLPSVDGGASSGSNGKPPPSPGGVTVVRSSGGYLPPRHPLATLQLSPASHRGAGGSDSGENGGGGVGAENGVNTSDEAGAGPEEEAEAEAGLEAPTLEGVPARPDLKSRGLAKTDAKGPAVDTPESERPDRSEGGPAPTEEERPAPTAGGAVVDVRKKGSKGPRRKLRYDNGDGDQDGPRSRSLSGVLSGLADWLMPGMEGGRPTSEKTELLLDVYPSAPMSPETRVPTVTRSAPPTPRGRRKLSSVLRDGGWFYNGDSDYSTEEEVETNYDSEDEGFWADAGTTKPPRKIGGGGGIGILDRLRKLFR